MSVHTSEELPPDAPVISAPFSLAITPTVAADALQRILGPGADLNSLSERELVCTYLAMHWIAKEVDLGPSAASLDHGPYVDSLPSRAQLRTPLHFTPQELALLKGTNMAAATTDREADWRSECERCRAVLGHWGEHLTWEHYLTASTHLSSRAFPSTLLSPEPALIPTPSSHPVLVPLIDSLNHARAHPVSWSVSPADNGAHTLSIVQHAPVAAGAEVLNNYGPKPNAELVLGYGFALPDNPDDTLVLKVSGAADRREIWRAGGGLQRILFDVLSVLVAQTGGPPTHAHAAIPLEYDGAFVLAEMLEARLAATPSLDGLSEDAPPSGVRPEVLRMLKFYVQGQREILRDAIAWAKDKIEEVAERAADLGIDLGEDEEDDSG
ncbi:SET domain-containing protein [Auricularia subglabra TFB-10046 SS5]|nr:SET domain-containing protein [Auricularia subglabra TFB-10046 SS5]